MDSSQLKIDPEVVSGILILDNPGWMGKECTWPPFARRGSSRATDRLVLKQLRHRPVGKEEPVNWILDDNAWLEIKRMSDGTIAIVDAQPLAPLKTVSPFADELDLGEAV